MAELLDELRPRAFAIAYRMLGSVSEAEDVVQEALVRLHGVLESGEEIEVPEAYLATVVTRLGIDRLRSAQVRRETYVGEWLPEPVVTGGLDDPAAHAEMSDSLSLAFLVLLERLSPEQRAVFLPREVFDYGYDAIAEIVGRTEAACRQLAVRARRHVEQDRPRFEASRQDQKELARRFMTATQTGDLDGLEALLAHDVALHGDGGGKARALAHPLFGRRRVARALLSYMRVVRGIEGLSIRQVEVNGHPGALGLDGQQRVLYALSLDIADGHIQGIRSIANPDKLRHLGPPATSQRHPRQRPRRSDPDEVPACTVTTYVRVRRCLMSATSSLSGPVRRGSRPLTCWASGGCRARCSRPTPWWGGSAARPARTGGASISGGTASSPRCSRWRTSGSRSSGPTTSCGGPGSAASTTEASSTTTRCRP